MQFSLTQFLFAVSSAIDYIEMDLLERSTNHGKKVSIIASKIGQKLGLSDEDIFDLAAYSIMHDSGLAGFSKLDDECSYEVERGHCVLGEKFVGLFPFLKKREDVLLYHHELYDGSGFFGKKGNEIPLFSQIINLADYVDVTLDINPNKQKLLEKLKKDVNKTFSKDLVEAYEEAQTPARFTMDLDGMFLSQVIDEFVPKFTIDVNYKDLIELSKVFSIIIDAKSKFTAKHSSGIAGKIAIMSDYYKFDEEKRAKLTIAANLHDLGKLAVSNAIIDKPSKLDDNEFNVMKQHTYFTRMSLKQIEGFEEITEWASNHHEKIVGGGYPMGFSGDRLDFGSRLMSCIDIYQALTEERPYRKGMTHLDAMKILRQNGESGAIDMSIVADIDKVFMEDYNGIVCF